jgi:hypothetical protein
LAVEGVDYAFPPWPDPAALAAAGKVFACRYGGPGSSDKLLDPNEALALGNAGISIVANAEGSAAGLLGGFSVGASWARTADAHFGACGMPADRPIYLSVDFDVTQTQWPTVRDALAGAASEIGLARVGVYGGRKAVAWARRDEVATWFWQTFAWSGGVWEQGNHIEQYRNGVILAGADCDLDRALTDDFGQWAIGGDMTTLDDRFRNADGAERSLAQMIVDQFDTTFTGAYGDTAEFVKGTIARLAAVEAKVDKLSAGGIDYDKLAAALVARLRPEVRDAIADFGEGGAAAVRAS